MTLIDDQDSANAGDEGEMRKKDVELQESADDLGIGDADDDPNADTGDEDEGDGDGKPDGEDDADADAHADGEERGKPPKTIPYDRFREVNEAKKAAQERTQQLEQQLAQALPLAQRAAELEAINNAKPANDEQLAKAVMDAQKAVREALFEDDEEAIAKAEQALLVAQDARADARAAAKDQAREEQRLEREAQAAKQRAAAEQERVNAAYAVALEQVTRRYPSMRGDLEVEAAVVAKRDALIAEGVGVDKALIEAAESVAKRMNITPAPGQAPAKSRRERSLERHLDAAERQPSRNGPAGDGVRQRQAGDHKLSREEYDRLPQADREVELGIR